MIEVLVALMIFGLTAVVMGAAGSRAAAGFHEGFGIHQ